MGRVDVLGLGRVEGEAGEVRLRGVPAIGQSLAGHLKYLGSPYFGANGER